MALTRILNDLLSAEAMSLVPQLKRMTVFVSWASANEADMVDDMVREEQQHEQWLVDAILDLEGYPNPISPSVAAGGIHYLELRTLLIWESNIRDSGSISTSDLSNRHQSVHEGSQRILEQ